MCEIGVYVYSCSRGDTITSYIKINNQMDDNI